MARARQTRACLTKLNNQFIQYGVTKQISYDEYLKLGVALPITRRELASLFNGRWVKTLRLLEKYFPHVYSDAQKAHKVTETRKESKAAKGLEALKSKTEDKGSEDE